MPVILKNNASSSLAAAITAADTGIVVRNGNLFPALAAGEYFYATLAGVDGSKEIVKVTARSGHGMSVVRAQEDTMALPFPVDSRVELRVTAASITDLVDEHDQASEISIADAGNYYTGTSTEAALQEVGAILATVPVNRGGTGATTADGALVNLSAQKKFAQVRKDVATLLADTTITYTAGTVNTVSTGDVVQTATEGFSYSVAASGASDHHVVTAGGVKLYVQPHGSCFFIGAFGDLSAGATAKTTLSRALVALAAATDFSTLDLEGMTLTVTSISPSDMPALTRKSIINGTIKSTTVAAGMFSPSALSDVVFENIRFESTVTATGDLVSGLVNFNDKALTDVLFLGCKFTCPNAAVNGIKIVNEATSTVDGISFVDCAFESLGRMGIEFQNHNVDEVVRIANVRVSGCRFKDTGLIDVGSGTRYGMGVSISGWIGSYQVAENSFISNRTIDIELVGAQAGVIADNVFESSASPISATGSRRMQSLQVVGNVSRNSATGNINLYNIAEVGMSDNILRLNGFVQIRDCGRVFDNSTIVTSGAYAVFMEGPNSASEDITLNGTYDNSSSASNFATLRASTTNVRRVRVGGIVKKPASGGVSFDSINSAPAINILPGAIVDGILSSGRGRKFDAGIVKSVSAANTATATITLVTANGSWRPGTLKVFVMACDNSGGSDAHGGVFIPINFLSNNVQIGSSATILTLSGITSIAATNSGTIITITVTTTATFTGQIAMDIEFVGSLTDNGSILIA